MRPFLKGMATVGEAMVVALALPIVILVVGTPLALVVRLVLEVVRAL